MNKLSLTKTKDSNGFDSESTLCLLEDSPVEERYNGRNRKPVTLSYQDGTVPTAFDSQLVIDRLITAYDPVTGNLTSRQRTDNNMEQFSYDILDRLTAVNNITTWSGLSIGVPEQAMAVTYAPNGNILTKTGVGTYDYDDSLRPHAVVSVSNADGNIPSDDMTTEFNDFGMIETIEDAGSHRIMDFIYGPDMQRWYTSLTCDGNEERTTTYTGNYEKVIENGVTREFYYLDGGTILVREDGELKPYMTFRDNLGSILAVYDEDGNKVFDASYDAWGRQTITLNTIGLQRGYTGHEMINEFDIINMNGRLYDPVLGRFFSPDNYVQMPDNSQNFNRYSYCLNNPLKYTDPSGNLSELIAFAAFSAINSMMQAKFNGENVWKAGALSLLSSAASYGIGEAFSGAKMTLGNELLRAGAHGLASGVISALDGGNFTSSFISGAAASGMGSYAQSVHINNGLMVASTTAMGGLVAWATGGDFLMGALQGMKIGLLNHSLHDNNDGIHYYHDKKGNLCGELQEVVVTANKTGVVNGSDSGFGIGVALSMAGLASSGYASGTYYKSLTGKEFWSTKSGKHYNSDILKQQSNGKYVRGVQGIRLSKTIAEKSVKIPSSLGKILGRASIAYSIWNSDFTSPRESTIDITRSILSYYSLPYAAVDFYISTSIEYTRQTQQFNIRNGLPINYGLYNTTSAQYW